MSIVLSFISALLISFSFTNKEADVVVWDRHPIRIGARPRMVFQEGVRTFTNQNPRNGPMTVRAALLGVLVPVAHCILSIQLPSVKATLMRNNAPVLNPLTVHSMYYAVTGTHARLRLSPFFDIVIGAHIWTMTGAPIGNATIIVRNGTVTCVGIASDCPVPQDISDRFVLAVDTKAPETEGKHIE